MRRAQNLELAREIAFVDSEASCETTRCTVTVVLTATKAGAVLLAVLIHKEQSIDGYLAAFKLLKEAHPLCFGGQPVMYADTAEKLEATTAELKALPHEAFVSRVEKFLQRQDEWVQLFRFDVLTSRVLRHASSRVAAHQLLYKRLLSRMPDSAAEAIQVVGSGHYVVPSATHPGFSYEVFVDIGLCTCSSGKQAGGVQQLRPSYRGTSTQQEEPDGAIEIMEGTSTHEVTHLTSVLPVPDEAQLAQALEHAYQFLEAQLRRVHAMSTHNPTYLEILKGLGEELARAQNSTDGTGLRLATQGYRCSEMSPGSSDKSAAN
ncbi:hypothetical protein MTO96_033160 [Rhipicephalus appendiculatus]